MIKFAQNKVCELQLEVAYDAFLYIVAYLVKKKKKKKLQKSCRIRRHISKELD